MADRNPCRRISESYVRQCQNHLARFTMRFADFALYARLTSDFKTGGLSYKRFRKAMRLLLLNPKNAHLRFYWHVYHSQAIGETRMADHPLFLYPAILWYMMDQARHGIRSSNAWLSIVAWAAGLGRRR